MLHRLQERDREIRQLHRLYQACAAGSGAVVVVGGPVGSGKTALLHGVGGRAAGLGALFATATASSGERHDPLGVIEQLLTALRGAARSAGLPAAGECAALAAAAAAGGRASRELLTRVVQVVTALAERVPVVLGVDDAHVADGESLTCLRYLTHRIDSAAVLVVVTECAGRERALLPFHAETLHLPHSHRIRLAPLSVAGVRGRLTERLGAAAVHHTDPAAWHRVSGGNPVLLNALLDDALHDRSGLPRATPVPGSTFRHAYRRCLHRAGPAALAAVRAAAVLGGPADRAGPPAGNAALMGALLGEDADVLRRTADDLIEAGLLAEDGGFRADAARLAVLAGLSAAELGALRCRAAEVLHQDGAPARVVAAQLLAARGTARPGWQTDVLRAAGTEAMSAGDAGPAVEHLRRAAELSVGTPREDETGAALAAAEWLVDPAAAARHLPRLARAVRAGRFATGEARPVAEQLVWHGEFTEADTVLRVAGEGCSGVPGAPVASAELAVLRDWFRLVCPDLGPPGDVGPAPAPSALLVRAAGLAAEGAGSAAGSGVTDRVLSGVRVDGPFRATLLLLACLLEEGRLTAADHWPEQLLSEPGQHGVPVRRALLRTVNALLALRRGELDRADRLARAGLFALTPEAWGIAIGAPLGLALRTATETGDTTAARAVLDVPVPVAMLGTPFALPYLYALGAYEAARDRGPEALRHFGRCRELADRWGLTGPGFADWWRRGSARLGRSPRTPAVSGADAPLPELTEAERRVGALAAAGRTNREIAELLLITVSTVEQHLTKVYRKLKVRRREDLPAPLAHFSGEVLNRVEESRV